MKYCQRRASAAPGSRSDGGAEAVGRRTAGVCWVVALGCAACQARRSSGVSVPRAQFIEFLGLGG